MAEEGGDNNVRVAVRCRPLSKREVGNSEPSIFQITDGHIVIQGAGGQSSGAGKNMFAFDFMYGPDSTQEQVYSDLGAPLLDKAFGGFNATIFAYGQTGSGKTHCMSGSPGAEGIIPRMNRELFDRVAAELAASNKKKFLVECSYFEVYNEILYDLLDPARKAGQASHGRGLDIKEDKVRGIFVKGLQQIVVESAEKLEALMVQGNSVRHQAATQMNDRSSRSHSIFCIRIQQRDADNEQHNVFAKINLVDLAGSERASKTKASGSTLREGANINKSLTTLGMVINKLAEKGKHPRKNVFIPYRNSKLTRVLQNSLGGNSLTCMLATLSPAASNHDETMTTLRYADRAKSIPVRATKNEEGAEIERLNKEVAALRRRLQQQAEGVISAEERKQLESKYKGDIEELEFAMRQTWEDKASLSKQYEHERARLAQQAEEERHALQKQYQEERLRRRQILAEKGDVALSIKELFSESEAAGKRCAFLQQDPSKWIKLVQEVQDLVQASQEQSTVAIVYKDGVESDIARLASHTEARAGVDVPTQQQLSAAVATLAQAQAKLKSLREEGSAMLDTQRQALAARERLQAALVAAFNAKPPETGTPAAAAANSAAGAGDAAVAAGAGAGVGAGGGDGSEAATEEGEEGGAVAEQPAPGEALPGDATHPGDTDQARTEYTDGLELVATQMAALAERTAAGFAKQRQTVFGLATSCDELVAALQAELALPSPKKNRRPSKSEGGEEDFKALLVEELQRQHHNHREELQECMSTFQALPDPAPGTSAGDIGKREVAVVDCASGAVASLLKCISKRLDTVRDFDIRQRVSEGARLKRLGGQVQSLTQKLETLRAQLTTKESELRTERESNARLTAEKETVSAYLASAMKKLDTAEEALTKERDARRTEVEQERVQVSKLTSQVADLTSMLDTTKGRLDRAMAREAAASKAKAELAKALESTTSAVDQGAASMEALKQEAATANARVEELTAQVEAAREELQAANKARAEAQVGAETATRQATAAQDAAAAATSRADEVTAEAEQLRQAATAADTERAAAVTAQLAAAAAEKEAVARAEAAEQQATELQQQVQAIQESLEQQKQVAEAEKARLAQMEDELLGVRGQLMKAEATQGHAGSKLGVLEARVEELEQENSKATAESEKLAAEAAAQKATIEELQSTISILSEERDLARNKEEEYFLELEAAQAELERIQTGYVELSDRLNDKLDEVFDLQSEVESAKAATLHWQQAALAGKGSENAAAAAGSGIDAIQKKRKENLLRATIIRIYEKVVSSFNTPLPQSSTPAAPPDAAAPGVPKPDPTPAAAAATAASGGGGADNGADDDDDDNYSDDYDEYEDDFEPLETTTKVPTTAATPAPSQVTPMSLPGRGAGSGATPAFNFADPALTTPRVPLTTDEVQDLPLDELCSRLEACIADVDARRVQLVQRLYIEVQRLTAQAQN